MDGNNIASTLKKKIDLSSLNPEESRRVVESTGVQSSQLVPAGSFGSFASRRQEDT